ncbi:TetR family transcriptional regulator [Isoptericola jiangsuensis]|uniref:TetR family transcriptional regulator n=1 Tax=Isoptericola jiangsuensis TaxID=548579 RepID=A0A2A9EVY4_9MICO|nr:TetR/AcrR family transcriptional regulator [Isoptericola jiangsuensis]PFG42736.1 TetR family transcriptional regulator [Isoptericola jiangsuensis]
MSPADPTGLRERKKRARAARIADAARLLVLDRGLDAVTVEEIAAAAEISPRTFFNYFESKDDAVLGQGSFDLDPHVREEFVAGGPTGRLLADLDPLVRGLLDALVGHAPQAVAQTLEILEREPRLLGRHFAWFERHKSHVVGLFERRHAVVPLPADPETCTMVVFVVARAAMDDWDRTGREGDVGDHVPVAVDRLGAIFTS